MVNTNGIYSMSSKNLHVIFFKNRQKSIHNSLSAPINSISSGIESMSNRGMYFKAGFLGRDAVQKCGGSQNSLENRISGQIL